MEDKNENEQSELGETLEFKSIRTSSILKPPKQRCPLLDVNFVTENDKEDFEAIRKRRVSFAGINKIREFNSNAGTIHVSNTASYDELCSPSDSSGMSMSGSCDNIPQPNDGVTEEEVAKAVMDIIPCDNSDGSIRNESMDITDCGSNDSLSRLQEIDTTRHKHCEELNNSSNDEFGFFSKTKILEGKYSTYHEEKKNFQKIHRKSVDDLEETECLSTELQPVIVLRNEVDSNFFSNKTNAPDQKGEGQKAQGMEVNGGSVQKYPNAIIEQMCKSFLFDLNDEEVVKDKNDRSESPAVLSKLSDDMGVTEGILPDKVLANRIDMSLESSLMEQIQISSELFVNKIDTNPPVRKHAANLDLEQKQCGYKTDELLVNFLSSNTNRDLLTEAYTVNRSVQFSKENNDTHEFQLDNHSVHSKEVAEKSEPVNKSILPQKGRTHSPPLTGAFHFEQESRKIPGCGNQNLDSGLNNSTDMEFTEAINVFSKSDEIVFVQKHNFFESRVEESKQTPGNNLNPFNLEEATDVEITEAYDQQPQDLLKRELFRDIPKCENAASVGLTDGSRTKVPNKEIPQVPYDEVNGQYKGADSLVDQEGIEFNNLHVIPFIGEGNPLTNNYKSLGNNSPKRTGHKIFSSMKISDPYKNKNLNNSNENIIELEHSSKMEFTETCDPRSLKRKSSFSTMSIPKRDNSIDIEFTEACLRKPMENSGNNLLKNFPEKFKSSMPELFPNKNNNFPKNVQDCEFSNNIEFTEIGRIHTSDKSTVNFQNKNKVSELSNMEITEVGRAHTSDKSNVNFQNKNKFTELWPNMEFTEVGRVQTSDKSTVNFQDKNKVAELSSNMEITEVGRAQTSDKSNVNFQNKNKFTELWPNMEFTEVGRAQTSDKSNVNFQDKNKVGELSSNMEFTEVGRIHTSDKSTVNFQNKNKVTELAEACGTNCLGKTSQNCISNIDFHSNAVLNKGNVCKPLEKLKNVAEDECFSEMEFTEACNVRQNLFKKCPKGESVSNIKFTETYVINSLNRINTLPRKYGSLNACNMQLIGNLENNPESNSVINRFEKSCSALEGSQEGSLQKERIIQNTDNFKGAVSIEKSPRKRMSALESILVSPPNMASDFPVDIGKEGNQNSKSEMITSVSEPQYITLAPRIGSDDKQITAVFEDVILPDKSNDRDDKENNIEDRFYNDQNDYQESSVASIVDLTFGDIRSDACIENLLGTQFPGLVSDQEARRENKNAFIDTHQNSRELSERLKINKTVELSVETNERKASLFQNEKETKDLSFGSLVGNVSNQSPDSAVLLNNNSNNISSPLYKINEEIIKNLSLEEVSSPKTSEFTSEPHLPKNLASYYPHKNNSITISEEVIPQLHSNQGVSNILVETTSYHSPAKETKQDSVAMPLMEKHSYLIQNVKQINDPLSKELTPTKASSLETNVIETLPSVCGSPFEKSRTKQNDEGVKDVNENSPNGTLNESYNRLRSTKDKTTEGGGCIHQRSDSVESMNFVSGLDYLSSHISKQDQTSDSKLPISPESETPNHVVDETNSSSSKSNVLFSDVGKQTLGREVKVTVSPKNIEKDCISDSVTNSEVMHEKIKNIQGSTQTSIGSTPYIQSNVNNETKIFYNMGKKLDSICVSSHLPHSKNIAEGVHSVSCMEQYNINIYNLEFMKNLGFSRISFTEWRYNLINVLSIIIEVPRETINELTKIKDIYYTINNKTDVVKRYMADFVKESYPEVWMKSICHTIRDVQQTVSIIMRKRPEMIKFYETLRNLFSSYPCKINNNIISFYIVDIRAQMKFDVDICLQGWRKITSHDIKITNVIGNIREQFVRNLFNTITDDEKRLQNFVRQLEDHVSSLPPKPFFGQI